ncbi:monocarboxylate transporter 13-like isoform X2 [Photinus pyralis]|uniref:monocarboxylate transporter 13-like isoform X2 n=1 Tax=Photinus pyralis TaxID=7054 RepID=UPI00126769A1|nr:monocarboxylate transporter 13-like isoform X2 [Photinus pyralis]
MSGGTTLIPPDGGWGWIIMFAYIINNLLIVPIQQNFGLLFKEAFIHMGMSGTNVTSVISTNMSASLLVGTCAGPLIKRFGIRNVAIVGSMLFTMGIISLALATNYTSLLVCYGLLTGIIRLTSTLSLNLYFAKKRRKVAGVALALRSLGSVVFPHIIVLFLAVYGTSSATLLIGGLCFHTVCASLLLRPVEWYMKKAPCADLPGTDVGAPLLSLNDKDQHSQGILQPHGILARFARYYDLALLKNSVYINITVGMMFSVFSDISFETLFALILSDLNFDDHKIAVFVSTSYISNIIIRFAIPFVGDYFRRSSRFMYALSCCVVIIGRFFIIYLANTKIVVTSIIWGVAHGMRTVYWSVIIADNVPAHQLPSAESMFIASNGVLCLICGPMLGREFWCNCSILCKNVTLGWIKDATGSFVNCVYVLNGFTLITCGLWFTEWFFRKIERKPAVTETVT